MNNENNNANRDPLIETRGAPPVDSGVVVAGPMARSLANGGAEKMDPTVEDAYWKTNYSKQEYVERNSPYTLYQPAYRTGYEGRIQYPGKTFEEVETNLQHDYETANGHSTLSWDKAKRATRDAWNRVDMALSGDADEDGR